MFSVFVWSSCGKWERELPFTEHQSLSYAVFTLILQGKCDGHLHFTETVKKQGWKSQDFNLGLNPIYTCALRILLWNRSLQSIFAWRLLSYFIILKNYFLELFIIESFKHNQKQSELYNKFLCTHHYYINYQLIANFVLTIFLYSSPHYFEAAFRHHIRTKT